MNKLNEKIYKYMYFSDSKDIPEKNILNKCVYTCEENENNNTISCNFSECYRQIYKMNHKDGEFCREVVEEIRNNPKSYLPQKIDKYNINRLGLILLQLNNKNCNPIGPVGTVSGSIDYLSILRDKYN
jgi:hypothetical protein